MINISDIQRKLTEFPEPKEVTEIRENILNSFNKLEFVEEGHKYFLPQKDGTKKELTSVSAFTHQFQQEQDWDDIARRYAVKNDMDVEDVKKMWHENNIKATNMGTGIHLYGENYQYFIMNEIDKFSPVILPQYEDGYLLPHSKKEEAVMHFYEDLFKVNNIYPVLAETKVYMGVNDKFTLNKPGFAGTFDMLFACKLGGKWKLLIYDFKTNASLSNTYNQRNDVRLLSPFDDMIEESTSLYTLQLSSYSLALQQLDYEIADRKLIWLKDDGTYEKISVPDVSQRILQFLQN